MNWYDTDREELERILQRDFVENPAAFGPGRRNDDTVDCMVIAWCLGKEPTEVIAKCADNNGWSDDQVAAVREHVERVQPYLEGWGKPGTMDAMVYTINY